MRFCLSKLLKIIEYPLKIENQTRFYPRWQHRRPTRVLTPEEFQNEQSGVKNVKTQENVIELTPQEIKVKDVRKIKDKMPKRSLVENVKDNNQILFDIQELDDKTHLRPETSEKKKTKKEVKYTEQEILNTTFDESGNYVYEKMKNNDPKIGTLMLLVKSRKLRKSKDFVLLEGKRLIQDALKAKCKIQHLMFSRKSDIDCVKDLLPKNDLKLYKMAYRDMQMWSDLTTCPGVMGIFAVPNLEKITPKNSIPLTIICDNIREPGNLGAILRSATAVGCEKILMTKGCVDLWESKVLRSSSGAHFRLPIYKSLEWTDIQQHIQTDSTVFLADNNILTSQTELSDDNLKHVNSTVPAIPYYTVNFNHFKSIVLVIGGETLGLSEHAYKIALDKNGARLNVPLENDVESLNTGTALGILAFEIKRQLLNNR